MSTQAAVTPQLRGMAASCPEALSDEELMRVLRAAEEREEGGLRDDLFGELFRRYHPRVTGWCFRVTHDQSSANDLAQEVFLKAYRHMSSFRGDSRISTWLYVITRNHCLTSLKKRASDPVDGSESVPARLRDHSAPDPDHVIERQQLYRRMWEMIGTTLEPMEARVMALHYGYEMPLAAITERLALSNPSGAKAYVVNARRKLNGVIKRRSLNAAMSNTAPPLMVVRKTAA